MRASISVEINIEQWKPDVLYCCPTCSGLFAYGQYFVFAIIQGASYLILHEPYVCCEEEHLIPLLLQTRAAAEEAAESVQGLMQEYGVSSVGMIPYITL